MRTTEEPTRVGGTVISRARRRAETPEVLRGMGSGPLEKSERALAELRDKGLHG